MKKIILLFVFVVLGGITLLAQAPPAPPSDASNGGANGPVGGGAPIGSGIVVLVTLAAGFGAKKVFGAFKNNPEQN